ncbi:hypothetical protein POSPLADRAFT_1129096 [Postia placenta MAD-698-R-SB12]|uniref:Uncharacterized protein n=1 Tax=Postia placenta MAD-698-R-SB12 TaxID=670580 RepID=A0A1X6NDQ6_9APHY|nr:hypothetical protein POSPLADRAFT_1129096 [Postia placenta MAD-698-R-SB12]OSX66771.1 hypothetical protein POSPLADRAFT_1129096 [Postia placenta MAD-698-R-SB12]
MDHTATHQSPVDKPDTRFEPTENLATAPDGNPLLQTDADVIAQTVELPPDPDKSIDVQLDLKDPEIRDVGWNRDLAHLPPTVVNGLSNEDLFALVRRFNKQVFYVKAIPPPPPGHLDLDISEDEEFSPDKLRAHLERLYVTVIVGMAASGKHIARIRSWNEPLRTACFCMVRSFAQYAYHLAWFSNNLGALLSLTLIALILHPPARKILFPPAPLAAVSASTGNLQVPRAGTIGSKDSLSGAPEAHKGEAVEQEATNFVSGFASLAVGAATGQKEAPHVEQGAVGVGAALPDPTRLVAETADAKHVAQGARADGKHDATKQHVQAAIWEKARPAMRALADITDTWERFANVLSPTPPFSHAPRLRLAVLVLPLLLATTVFRSEIFVKAGSFGLGFALFGQPLISRGAHWLTHRFPNWREMLQLRRSILKGVPTNAQLTLTLLRIAEESKTPLPPPPPTNGITEEPEEHPDGIEAAVREHDDMEFDTSNYDVEGVDAHMAIGEHAENAATGEDGKPRPRLASKLARALKGTGKAAVSSALGIDHLKARLGSEAAKRRLGAVPDDSPGTTTEGSAGNRAGAGDGPTAWAARWHGKRGYIVLVTSAASPFVAFVKEKDINKNLIGLALPKGISGSGANAPTAAFSVALAEVQGLKKVGGYGWKGKMVIGYVLQREVLDGLEIEDEDGKTWTMTAIKGRDELFNRLIAVGGHKWECR